MAVEVRSSCSTSLSLRSISSRRRRIKERLLSEVINAPKNEAPAGGGRGACPARASVSRAGRYLNSARPLCRTWEMGDSHLLSPTLSTPLSRSDPRPKTCLSAPKICSLKPQTEKRPQPVGSEVGPGASWQSGSKVEFGPSLSASRRAECFLVVLTRSWVLLVHARDLLV